MPEIEDTGIMDISEGNNGSSPRRKVRRDAGSREDDFDDLKPSEQPLYIPGGARR